MELVVTNIPSRHNVFMQDQLGYNIILGQPWHVAVKCRQHCREDGTEVVTITDSRMDKEMEVMVVRPGACRCQGVNMLYKTVDKKVRPAAVELPPDAWARIQHARLEPRLHDKGAIEHEFTEESLQAIKINQGEFGMLTPEEESSGRWFDDIDELSPSTMARMLTDGSVPKKDGKLRFSQDLQPANKVMIRDAGVGPLLEEWKGPWEGPWAGPWCTAVTARWVPEGGGDGAAGGWKRRRRHGRWPVAAEMARRAAGSGMARRRPEAADAARRADAGGAEGAAGGRRRRNRRGRRMQAAQTARRVDAGGADGAASGPRRWKRRGERMRAAQTARRPTEAGASMCPVQPTGAG
ncbi:MAG: hypothetical protein BJ554DRAFT_2114, partial [Olpidium bornovanus]